MKNVLRRPGRSHPDPEILPAFTFLGAVQVEGASAVDGRNAQLEVMLRAASIVRLDELENLLPHVEDQAVFSELVVSVAIVAVADVAVTAMTVIARDGAAGPADVAFDG